MKELLNISKCTNDVSYFEMRECKKKLLSFLSKLELKKHNLLYTRSGDRLHNYIQIVII